MTAGNRDELLREAGALKLRAMRLRTFGEEDERWEAVVLLREAASKELAALELFPNPSHEEQTGVLVEACGLFLEAGDPVSAADQWKRMPSWAFSSEHGEALLASLRLILEDKGEAFCDAWSLLRGRFHRSGVPSVAAEKVRAAIKTFPGVAVLWWALAVNLPSSEEASGARSRALRLDPTLGEDEAAKGVWLRVDETFSRILAIELKAERPQDVLTLDPIGRIVTVAGSLISDYVEKTLGALTLLVPSSAKTGSFIVDVTARGLPSDAIERLDRELSDIKALDARALSALLGLLQAYRVRLALSVTPFLRSGSPKGEPLLVIDAKRRKAVASTVAELIGRTRIESSDVPQADHLERVFLVAELIARQEHVDEESLGKISVRQVSYYRRAAIILGLLTESYELTASGRLIARLGPEDRFRATVVLFESSICGDAWIQWSNGKTLLDVKAESAAQFLQTNVSGLTGDTVGRRAQTLTAWHRLLVPYHYAAADTLARGPSSNSAS